VTGRSIVASVVLGAAVVTSSWLATGTASAHGRHVAGASGCSGVSIKRFAFHPSSVPPGRSSSAALTARNCAGSSLSATVTWAGRFVGSGVGVPAGCPVIDPVARPVHLAPHRSAKSSQSYLVIGSCTATSLQVTASIQTGGHVLATATAVLTIT
jgi:hypothetical protein